MTSPVDTGDSTPSRQIVVAQLNKTKMCIQFSRGSCTEAQCRFAHSAEELRQPPDLAKTAICRAFARGACHEADCKFAHGEEELRVSPSVYKTQLCNFFARGHCKKGDRCRHAHGKKELRSFQASADGGKQAREEVVKTSPPRGGAHRAKAELAAVTPPPGLSRPVFGDISNNQPDAGEEATHETAKYETPVKAKHKFQTPTTEEPWKVPLPECPSSMTTPVQKLQFSPDFKGAGWDENAPAPWAAIPELPGPSGPYQECFASPLSPGHLAAAAAAAAQTAQEHTAAASVASAAAMTWAHAAMHQKSMQAAAAGNVNMQGLVNFLATLAEQNQVPGDAAAPKPPAPSMSTGSCEGRKWVL